MSKKILAILLTLAMVFSMAACSSNDGGDGEGGDGGKVTTIKAAHWFAEDHPQHKAFLKFKEVVEEKSGGSLKVEIYPNSQLGSEDTYIDSVKQGTVQVGATGTMIAKYAQHIYAAETPFLVTNWQEAQDVYTGDIINNITDGFVDESGMYIKAVTVNGFRQFSSNKTMNEISEFKGQRIRVPNVPNYVQMVEALGATAIAMSLTELFTALEQDAVDGQDNPFPTDVTSSFYEVQKYALQSNHMFSPMFWVMNQSFYDGLTDEEKAAVDAGFAEANAENWTLSIAYNDEAKQTLLDNGMEITEPDDAYVAELQKAMEPVYDWYIENFAGNTEAFFKAVWAYQGK
ncbi:MAG: TRAP transporter substrate-binding protein [Firmicutes bacterium]|nr:TRAP transporter substrate-binding protein [Bacillota bacterium]